MVRADAEQLRQVFLNLAINAVQAMPSGGKLQVSTSLRRSTRRARRRLPEVRFRDTGTGIPVNDVRNLFIPFFTTKEKGTGLGLPISQRIIENHGGTIEVRLAAGVGRHLHRAPAHRGRRLRQLHRPAQGAAAAARSAAAAAVHALAGADGRDPRPRPQRASRGAEVGYSSSVPMARDRAQRVLIADDEINIRRVLEAILRRDGYDVGHARPTGSRRWRG
jgi:hypothetical protein